MMKKNIILTAWVIGLILLANMYYRYMISLDLHRKMLMDHGLVGYWLTLGLPAVLFTGPIIYLIRHVGASLSIRILIASMLSAFICIFGVAGRTMICVMASQPSCL